jgi:hypothetical protein
MRAIAMNKIRHAFLILAHDKPDQLQRLVDALQHERFDLYLHLDAKVGDSHPIPSGVHTTISEFDISWGGFSMVEATLALLSCAKRAPRSYHSYTLLSGTDYPVASNEYIHQVLASTDGNRIDYWHDEDPSWHKRYTRFYFHDWPDLLARIANALSRRISRILPDRNMPPSVKPYFGSQWWTLSDRGVEAVLQFIAERPDVRTFMRHVHIPDEMFFQTALTNVDAEVQLVREPLRYLDWSKQRAHPGTIQFGDLEEVLQGDWLFARKFNERSTPGILDAVERMRHPASSQTNQEVD